MARSDCRQPSIDLIRARNARREIAGSVPGGRRVRVAARAYSEEVLMALSALSPSSAPSWSCATCSSTRLVRSHVRWSSRAAPSTRGCGADWMYSNPTSGGASFDERKRVLSRFRAPEERETEERAWEIVRAAYRQREPPHAAGRRRPVALAATSILIAGAGALTPAGATVGRLVDHAFERPHGSRPAFTTRAPSPQALVTDETQNRMLVVDLPSGRIARSVPVPLTRRTSPRPATAASSLSSARQAGKVTILNRDTLKVIRTFSGFDRPHIAAISPDDQYAYITDDARGTFTVIRLSDMKVTDTVAVGIGAHHLAFSPTERRSGSHSARAHNGSPRSARWRAELRHRQPRSLTQATPT